MANKSAMVHAAITNGPGTTTNAKTTRYAPIAISLELDALAIFSIAIQLEMDLLVLWYVEMQIDLHASHILSLNQPMCVHSEYLEMLFNIAER